jgi:hypothetical protein
MDEEPAFWTNACKVWFSVSCPAHPLSEVNLLKIPFSQALMQQAFQRPDSFLFADKLGVGRSESKHHDNLVTILPDCTIR